MNQTFIRTGVITSQPFVVNLVLFATLLLTSPLFSSQTDFFAILTIVGIFVLAFDPFKLVLIYTVLIFYRDIFVGEIFGAKTDMLEYLTICSNYVFVVLLASLVLYRVQMQWRSPFFWPIAIFVGTMFVCTIFSSDRAESLQVLFRLIQLVGYFFVLYTLLNSERRIFYFLFVLLGVFLIVIIVSGYNFLLSPDRLAHLARFMIFPALASGLFIYFIKSPLTRLMAWWLIFIAAAGSLSLLITESRRVLLALFISWVSFLIVSRSRVGWIIFLSIFIIGAFAYSPKKVLSRFQKTATSLEVIQTGKALDEEEAFNLFTGRDKLWALGFEKFSESPVFGIGLGVSKAAAVQKFGKPLRLHNIYLELLVETGVVGFAAFVILLISFLVLCLKMIAQHKPSKNFYFHLAVTLLSIILVFYATNYFGGASVFEKYEWVFYAILAAGFRAGMIWKKKLLVS